TLVKCNLLDEAVGRSLSPLLNPFLSGDAFAFALFVALVNLLALFSVTLQVTGQFNADARWATVLADDRVEYFAQLRQRTLNNGIGNTRERTFYWRKSLVLLAVGKHISIDFFDRLWICEPFFHMREQFEHGNMRKRGVAVFGFKAGKLLGGCVVQIPLRLSNTE